MQSTRHEKKSYGRRGATSANITLEADVSSAILMSESLAIDRRNRTPRGGRKAPETPGALEEEVGIHMAGAGHKEAFSKRSWPRLPSSARAQGCLLYS